MELKPGYKETEVGMVPAEWDIHTIGNSVRLVNGRAFKSDDWKSQGLPIIRIQNLNNASLTFNYYSGPVEDRHRVENGDILFAWSGTTGTSFGARIWGGPSGVLNQHIFKVLPDPEKLTPRYAFLVLLRVQEEIEKRAHGFKASFVHVKKSDLVGIQLPLPPTKREQDAIAGVLSDADAFIGSLEQIVAKKRHLKQGAMQELLTGKKRLPGFSVEWEIKCLKDACRAINDGTHFTPDYVESGIPFYSVENVTANDFTHTKFISLKEHDQLIKRCHPEKGDILLTRIGAIGDTKLIDWDVEASIYVSLALLKVREDVDSHFLYCYTKCRKFVNDIEGRSLINASPKKINMADIGGVPLLMPPLAEQRTLAAIFADMDAEIAALESKLAKARQIKQGMMQNLLTGRIRLI